MKKIKVTQEQFSRLINEDFSSQVNRQPGQSSNFLNTIIDPNFSKKAEDNINKLSSLKKKADDIIMKEQEPEPQRMEIQDHIDDLLLHLYGFTYFKDKSTADTPETNPQMSLFNKKSTANKVPFYQTMDDMQKGQYSSKCPAIEMIVKGDLPGALNSLLRLKQNMNENLVKSEMFRIIAEAETAKISKAELLNFLNKKK